MSLQLTICSILYNQKVLFKERYHSGCAFFPEMAQGQVQKQPQGPIESAWASITGDAQNSTEEDVGNHISHA